MGLLSNAVRNATQAEAEAKADIVEAMGVEDYAEPADIVAEDAPYIVMDEDEERALLEPQEEAASETENSSTTDPGQAGEGDASSDSASGTPESPVQEGEQAGSAASGQPGASEGQLAELTGGRFSQVDALWKDRCNLESLVGRQGQELGQLRAQVKEMQARDAVEKTARHFEDLSPEEQADVTREARQRGIHEDDVLRDRYLLAQADARAAQRESARHVEERVRHRAGVDAWLAQQYDSNPDAKQAIDNVSSWFPDTFARLMDEAPSERMVDEIQNLVALGYRNNTLEKQIQSLNKELETLKAAEAAKVSAAVAAGKKAAYDEKTDTQRQARRAASEAQRGGATAPISARESQPQGLGAALERHALNQSGFLKRSMERSRANK